MENITVMSYNIASCFGLDIKCIPQRSLEVIKSANADIITLQEVAVNCPDRANVDYPKMAAQELGCYSAFGRSMFFNHKDEEQGMYGNGILSKYPLEKVEVFYYDIPEGREPRSALIMKVLADTPFYVVVTHLPYQGEYDSINISDEEVRVNCLKKLQEHIIEKKYFPVILTGDLNSTPQSSPIEFLRKEWTLANDISDYPPTVFASKEGWVHIDYIAFYPNNAFKVLDFQRFGERGPSDHYPVLAKLTINN